MKIITLYFGIIFLVCGERVTAQPKVQFYLIPHIGVEFPFSFVEQGTSLPPFLVGARTNISTEKAGLSLMADINGIYTVEIGYGFGHIGWGVAYEKPSLYKNRKRNFTSTNLNRIYFNLSRPVYRVVIPKSNLNVKNKFWAIFDLNIMLGFSRENLNMMSYAESFPFGSSGVHSNSIIDRDSVTVLKDRSYSIHGGAALQFYHKGKKRLQLGFLYHQGLSRMVKITKTTRMNGVTFPDFNIYTRGSMFAFYLAYPILID